MLLVLLGMGSQRELQGTDCAEYRDRQQQRVTHACTHNTLGASRSAARHPLPSVPLSLVHCLALRHHNLVLGYGLVPELGRPRRVRERVLALVLGRGLVDVPEALDVARGDDSDVDVGAGPEVIVDPTLDC